MLPVTAEDNRISLGDRLGLASAKVRLNFGQKRNKQEKVLVQLTKKKFLALGHWSSMFSILLYQGQELLSSDDRSYDVGFDGLAPLIQVHLLDGTDGG